MNIPPVLKKQGKYLSAYALPVILLIYIFLKNTRSTLYLHFITIFTISIIDNFITNDPIWWKIFVVIYHSILILLIIFMKPDKSYNLLSILCLFISILGIHNMKKWPYKLSKTISIIMYSLIYNFLLSYFLLIQNKLSII